MTVTGRCGCGAVRFTLSGPLRPVINCHCSRCRRWTGHFMAATNTAVDDLSFDRGSDSVKWWTPDEEPAVAYGFCTHCGGSLFWRSNSRPGRYAVLPGLLTRLLVFRLFMPCSWPKPAIITRLIPTFLITFTIPVPTASKAKTSGNPPSGKRQNPGNR